MTKKNILYTLIQRVAKMPIFSRSLLLTAASSTMFMLLFVFFLTPIYEINDDVFTNLITNGYYTGTPSPYVFNMSAFIGFFLVSLYRLAPDINWYGVIMYFCLWAALTVTLFSVFYSFRKKESILAGLCFLIIFYLHFTTSLTFTFVAVLLAASGFILFSYAHSDISGHKKVLYSAAFIFFLLSNFIRRGSMDMIFALSLPAILFLFLTNRKNRIMSAVFICLTIVTIFCLREMNLKLYPKTPEWLATMKPAPFNDCYYSPTFCEYDAQQPAYMKTGWSKNDYQMLMNFFYDDGQIFSSDKGIILKNNIQISRSFPLALRNFGYHLLVIIILSFLFIQAVVLLVAINGRYLQKQHLLSIGATTCIALIYIAFFIFRGYLPVRFVVSIVYFIGVLAITPLNPEASRDTKSISTFHSIILSFFIFFTLAILFVQFGTSKNNRHKIDMFRKIYQSLPANKNDITFIWGSSIPYEWQNPLIDPKYMKERNIIIGAWTQQTIYNDIVKQKFDINNMYTDLYENSHVYIVASEYQQTLLKIFMKEHHRQIIDFLVIKNFKEYGFPTKLLKVITK